MPCYKKEHSRTLGVRRDEQFFVFLPQLIVFIDKLMPA